MKTNISNIVIIGMPGVGKSTVGRALADAIKWPFFDSDEVILDTLKLTPAQLIEDRGEAYFRHKEALVVAGLLAATGYVISLGGGAVLDPDAAHALKKQKVIWLKASETTLGDRLKDDTSHPLLKGDDKPALLKAMLEKRTPIYQAVKTHEINVDGKTPEAIVDELKGLLDL